MLSLSTPQVSPERLMQFTFGFAPPLMIETAIRCGIFDILEKGPKSLDALCLETAHRRAACEWFWTRWWASTCF
jgi:hypothetical protein